MAAIDSPRTPTLELVVGGDRLRDLLLEADDILLRWNEELAAADAAAKAEAATAVSTTASDSPSVPDIVLVLRCRSWSVQCLTRFVPFIERIAPRVVELQADDIIAQQVATEGYEVIRLLVHSLGQAQRLVKINLNENALGPPSILNLQPLLTPRVTSLTLFNTGVDAECMRILQESIFGQGNSDHARHCALEELVLSRNTIGTVGATQVGDYLLPFCPQLRVFHYAAARAGVTGSTRIAQGFQKLARNNKPLQVRELDLRDCSFEYEPTSKVPQPLVALCEALTHMPHLRKLLLQDCAFDYPALELVIDTLTASNAPLEEFNLGDMEEFGERGAVLVSTLLDRLTRTLKVLSLEGNDLGWRGLAVLLPFFSECTTLETVDLSRNEFGPLAVDQLLSIPTPKWKKLILEQNLLEDEDLQERIVHHFSETEVVFGDEQDDRDEPADDNDQNQDNDNEEEEEEEMSQQFSQVSIH